MFKPWNHVGKLENGTPFTAHGCLEWCDRCKMGVDTDTDSRHRYKTYVYRTRCLRCGKVIRWGVYRNVPLINSDGMGSVALEWALDPCKDRR